jgi:asparagine synthase (glutamine-hydrolysing)
MCGILGYFSIDNDYDHKKFAEANNIVEYRGPDDHGYITIDDDFGVKEWWDKWLNDFRSTHRIIGSAGFCRLSVTDLSSQGHQPMHEGNFNCWIVLDGEVYNYPDIRNELLARGCQFRSKTDTEVVLKSYLEWRSNCLEKFNGMWAFCILDTRRRKIFCARDRLGIKPLYYYFDTKRFIFASEVKQILALLPFRTAMNSTVLFDYLALGSYGNETQETFFESVYKLLPGSFIEVDFADSLRMNLKRHIWWDLPVLEEYANMCEKDIFESIRFLLEDSIRLRLRSDVPVGTCLSGGLDSSGIVCLVDRINKNANNVEKQKVFVIGSINPRIDETHYARIIIDRTYVEPYFSFPDSIDLEKDLETFIWHHDEPLITASMFGGWHVYKLAKQNGVKVVLDGQGSDELLGGYYFGVQTDNLSELLNRGEFATFFREFKSNVAVHNVSKLMLFKKILYDNIRRIARNFVPTAFRPGIYKRTHGWLKQDFIRVHTPKSHVLMRHFPTVPRGFSSVIKKHSYEFMRYTSLPGILRQVDRNSMAFSVQARVPFLDHRLVEFLYGLPAHQILRNGYTKFAYREAMKAIIPDEIRLRTDKRGFAMPDRELLFGALPFVREIIDTIPNDSQVYEVGNIAKNIETHLKNESMYEPIIWRIINAAVWQTRFRVQE